ncbi:hypothetical protein GCM10022261_17470 [Brevibacterium daeguense]|uniref:Uncharacterized protein n=1 Tax=Brevibacterium daeguense TaxID=909936 RepID=A0ABP8EJS6_9MICO|nr:hypothetical protein [Brevibacterium daeguense]
MTDNASNEQASVRHDQLQAIFDRVQSWQESAPDSTVRDELKKAIDESGFDNLDDQSFDAMVDHIENERGPADVATVVNSEVLR